MFNQRIQEGVLELYPLINQEKEKMNKKNVEETRTNKIKREVDESTSGNSYIKRLNMCVYCVVVTRIYYKYV